MKIQSRIKTTRNTFLCLGMLSVIFSHILQTIRQEHLKNKRLKNFDLSDLKDKKFSVQDLEQGIVSYWNLQPSTGGRWV